MSGRKRRLLAMDRAPTPSARTQALHVPDRQTPMSLNDDPRFRRMNQSAITKDHSCTNPPQAHRPNLSSGVPCRAAGIWVVIILETAHMTAGETTPKIADSTQHRSRGLVTIGLKGNGTVIRYILRMRFQD